MTEADTIAAALDGWGLRGARVTLIAARENRVFRVDPVAGAPVVLRLHRRGYRGDGELRAELFWLRALAARGLSVPQPIPDRAGALLRVIDGVQVDLIRFLDGAPMGATGAPLVLTDRAGAFHALGRAMAELHRISDDLRLPEDFTRCAWDRDGLLGDAPLWGRFWENPTLTPKDAATLRRFRDAARGAIGGMAGADYGLIHGDLVRENVMIAADGAMHLIDFDDGGFGYRLFDIATTLRPNLSEPDYPALKAALIAGYHAVRPLATEGLEMFLALRAATYVGWIVPRLSEPGAAARNRRNIALAVDLAEAFLRRGAGP